MSIKFRPKKGSLLDSDYKNFVKLAREKEGSVNKLIQKLLSRWYYRRSSDGK